MTLSVPKPVADYLAAEQAKDAGRLSLCFTINGLVHDEGHNYRGRDAIRQWNKPRITSTATRCGHSALKTRGNEITMRARLTGDFPGSPVELNHFFKLSNDKIASLEIRS